VTEEEAPSIDAEHEGPILRWTVTHPEIPGSIKFEAGPEAFLVSDGTGDLALYHVPATVRVNDFAGLPYDFELGIASDPAQRGRIVIDRIEVLQRLGGPGITARGLRRVPVGGMFELSLAMLNRHDTTANSGSKADHATERRLRERAIKPIRRPRKRIGVTDLKEVADAARLAPAGQLVKTVMTARGCGEANAKRLIREARAAGYLEHSQRSKRDS
jgi:hypothetical protein